MIKIKKLICILMSAILAGGTLAGCAGDSKQKLAGLQFEGELEGKVSYEYTGTRRTIDLSFAGITARNFNENLVSYTVEYADMSGNALSEQPVDSGQYKMSAILKSALFEGEREAILEIRKKELTVEAEDISVTYGQAFEPDFEIEEYPGIETDVFYRGVNDTSYPECEEKPELPGDYKITVEVVHDNYAGIGEAALTIGARLGRASLTSLSHVYDGTAKRAEVQLGGSFQKIESITYKGIDVTYNSSDAPINAGRYKVEATLTTDGKMEKLNSENFIISPKLLNLTAQDISITCGQEIEHQVSSQDIDVLPEYSVTYTDEENKSFSSPVPSAPGKYGVKYKITDPNYSGETEVALTISARLGKLRLSDLNAVYDGQPKAVQIAGLDGSYHQVIAIQYSEDGIEYTETAPIDAGEYKVRATVKTDGVDETLTGTLRISSLAINIVAEDISVFAGDDFEPQYTISGEHQPDVSVTYIDADNNETSEKPAKVGVYTIRFEVTGSNFSGEKSVSLTIRARTNRITLTGTSHEYDGNAKEIVLSGLSGFHTDISILYSGTGETVYESTETAPHAAGTYSVAVTLKADGIPESYEGQLKINPKRINVTIQDREFDVGEEITHNVSWNGYEPAVDTYEIRYYSEYPGDYTLLPPSEAGEYIVRLVVTDPNYSGGAEALYTIKARIGIEPVIGNLRQTFGNTGPVTYTLNEAHEFVSLTYSGIDIDYPESSTAPEAAGRYEVKLTVLTDGTEKEIFTKNLTISKVYVQLTAGDINVSGGEDFDVSYSPTLFNETDFSVAITYKGTGDTIYAESSEKPTLAGTYIISLTINDPNIEGHIEAGLSINARLGNISVTGLNSNVYDGTNKAAVISAPYSDIESVTYEKDGNTYVVDGPKDAGSYQLTITAKTDGQEEIVRHTFIISQKPLQLTAQDIEVMCGDEITHSLSVAGGGDIPEYSVNYKNRENDVSPLPPALAGSYTVTYTVTNPNYTGTASANLTIAARLGRLSVGNLLHIYDGQPKSAVVSGIEEYHSEIKVMYRGTGSTTYPESETAPVHAGTYITKLTATADGAPDENYEEKQFSIMTRAIQLTAQSLTVYAGDDYNIDYSPRSYNGEDFEVSVQYEKDGLYSSEKPHEPGIYNVTVTIISNDFSGTASAALTIKSNVERIVFADSSAVYSGESKTAAYSGLEDPVSFVSLTYEGIEGTVYPTSEQAPKNAGTYNAVLTVAENGQNTALTSKLTISKANVTVADFEKVHDYQPAVRPASFGTLSEEDIKLEFAEDSSLPGTHIFNVVTSGNVTASKMSGSYKVYFNNSIKAFEYAQAYHINAPHFVSTYTGKATASLAQDQYTYTEKFKSSHPDSTVKYFYATTNSTPKGSATFGGDTRFALQMHVTESAGMHNFFYRSIHGGNDIPVTSQLGKIVVNFTGEFIGPKTADEYKTAWGVNHTGLTGYIINENTVSAGNDNIELTDGKYSFTFTLKAEAMADYFVQVKKFSNQTAVFVKDNPPKVTFTLDEKGRVCTVKVEDRYKVILPVVSQNGNEEIDYDTNPVITSTGRTDG